MNNTTQDLALFTEQSLRGVILFQITQSSLTKTTQVLTLSMKSAIQTHIHTHIHLHRFLHFP